MIKGAAVLPISKPRQKIDLSPIRIISQQKILVGALARPKDYANLKEKKNGQNYLSHFLGKKKYNCDFSVLKIISQQ